ncbi:MAG: hypothetical protein IJN34_04430 [Clostridia bacterium]|nr:hypothetical protein [Clostridia bacterium]
METLIAIRQIFSDFDQGLREYRQSLDEALANSGMLGDAILNHTPISRIEQNDREVIDRAIQKISNSGYSDSISISKELLNTLDERIKKLSTDNQSGGKSLPLVTGSVGLLVAVLLF